MIVNNNIEEGSEEYYSEDEFESETSEKAGESEGGECVEGYIISTYLAAAVFDIGGGEDDVDEALPVIELPSQVVVLRKLLLHSVGFIAPRNE